MIVLNAEPLNYSQQAIKNWLNKGYVYNETSWEEIDEIENDVRVRILIVRLSKRIDEKVLNKFPNLKCLVTATTGLDHVDLDVLKRKGIDLVSLREHKEFLKTIPSTAEHTFALLLALVRYIPSSSIDVGKGNWLRDNFKGIQLQNKTIGIIGLGRIGSKMAEYCKSFGMNVIYFDPNVNSNLCEKIYHIEDLFAKSDIITFHIHLASETLHFFNENSLKYVKPNVYIINTSRGAILDELAVVKGLKNNLIKGVAVDVLENELDNLTDSPLWKAHHEGENIIITPHIGGATYDAMWACEEYISNL